MWRRGNTLTLLVGMLCGPVSVKISMEVSPPSLKDAQLPSQRRAAEMNEQRVTYAELKLAKDSKRPQVKSKENKRSTTGTEPGVTYAELSLRNVSRDPQEKGKSCHLKGLAAPPEKLIAGILGLTCLVLICIIVPVWVYTHRSPEEQEKNDSSTVTDIQKAYPCGPCPKGWFKYSKNCYYFSAEQKTWKESMTACQSNKSQLLYIDTEEEMELMNVMSVLSWIGVYRNSSNQPWTFVNGSTFHPEIRKPISSNEHCVMLHSKYYADKCESPKMFYCKHKI